MSIKKNVGCKQSVQMKTHKLTLHCRNNDILLLRKDKYSKQACYTFKFNRDQNITKTRMSTNKMHNQQNM